MRYKYIILDFGNVLVTPTTGDWFMTPKFLELVDVSKINKFEFNRIKLKYDDLLSKVLKNQEEEYEMFSEFYYNVLKGLNYPECSMELAKAIAYDMTYNSSKYTLCSSIHEELKHLKEKYTLILLTDNWPCVIPYLKSNNLYDYFSSIYNSSDYGILKKDGVFFNYPIRDYNIKPGEALFIDDNENNLDEAKVKGLDVLLMDRSKKVNKSKYRIINDLFNI